MNLVAKEFVASRFDNDGVLILSPFAGAALELTHSLIVNPYATEEWPRPSGTRLPCRNRNATTG